MTDKYTDLKNKIRDLINDGVISNRTKTHGFILGEFLKNCLLAFEHATTNRDFAIDGSFPKRNLPPWISVDDRLPEKNVPVWIWVPKENYLIAAVVIDNDDGCSWASCYQSEYWNGENWETSTRSVDYNYEPSHWMPLPLPPAGGDEVVDENKH